VSRDASDRREVWLRGNVRPALGLGVAAALLLAAILAGLVLAGTAAWFVAGVALVAVVALAAVTAVGLAAAGPRLARRGDALEIQLAPGRVERVPLDVVECIFRGTEPVAAGEAESADGPEPEPRYRVGTLVVRFAERSGQWRERETFRPWGSWTDGHAVIDGRWCEPLSRETVERVAANLLIAKREVAGGG
jgi:hypothetical protein